MQDTLQKSSLDARSSDWKERAQVVREGSPLSFELFLIAMPVFQSAETGPLAKTKHFIGLFSALLLELPCSLVPQIEQLHKVCSLAHVEQIAIGGLREAF